MKKYRGFIILCAVLVILVVGYFILSSVLNKDEPDDTKIPLRTFGKEELASISIKNDVGNYTFIPVDGEWLYAEDTECHIDTYLTSALADIIYGLYAERVISENQDDAPLYGLIDPRSTIVISNNDGETITYKMGKANNGANIYYFTVENDPYIYAIPAFEGNAFVYSLESLMKVETLPAMDEYVTKLTFWSKDTGSYEFYQYTKENEQPLPAEATSKDQKWFMGAPFQKLTAADTELLEKWVFVVEELQFPTAYKFGATEEEIDSLGLNDPVIKVTIDYLKRTFSYENGYYNVTRTPTTVTVLLGKREDKEDGMYFCMPEGGNTIYKTFYTLIDRLVEIEPEAMVSRDICRVDLDSVRYLISSGVRSFSATVSGENISVGGQDVTEKFTPFYEKLISIKAEKLLSEKVEPQGSPYMSFTFGRSGKNDITADFYEYNSNFYLAVINGKDQAYVSIRDIQELEKLIGKF